MSTTTETGKRPERSLALRLLSSSRPHALRQRLAEIRATVIDRLWLSLFIVALIGVPMSVLRSGTTGWLPLYDLHIALGVLVACVFLVRHRLSVAFKLGIIVALFWVVGLSGLISTGLLGAGAWWLALSVLLISALYSVRAGVLTSLLTFAVTLVAAVGFTQGWLSLPFDANVYVRTASAWGNIVVGVVLLPLLVFSTVTSFHGSTLQLLEEVDAQREMIRQLATHDDLTGVPTFRLATDRLEQAMLGAARAGGKVAVLFIDLDGFKSINDTHGHEAGDTILKTVAKRCREVVRADDTIARKSGDEFIAILRGVEGQRSALALAQRMIDSLSEPVSYNGQSLRVGASIGIALFPEHAQTPEDMIRAGDGAMYEAKRAGANRARMAEPLAAQTSA